MARFKQKNSMDMTKGSTVRLMIAFALPILLSQTFQQLYNTADAFIVGKALGTDAFAAVSSSGNLTFLMISFFMGLSLGAGVVISRYFGANDADRVSKAIHTNIVVGLISSVLLTVVGTVFTPTFLSWMKVDPEVMPQAVSYYRVYFAGVSAMVMYNMLRGIMNALGDSQRPLYYLIFSSVINVILDILFVAVFHWGVWAAALATVISQAASVVLCLIHLLEKGNIYTVEWNKLRIDKEMFLEILHYGVPSGVQNSVIGFANVIVQSEINSFGKIATAAYGAYSRLEGFAFLPITSFTMAITTFISQNLGAGEYDRAKKGARFGIWTAVIMAELVGVVFFVFAPSMIGWFDSTESVMVLGARQARIASLFYCLLAYSHSIASVCRGAGKAVVPMAVMLSVWCVFRILYIKTVMALLGEIHWIYWAYPITWTISSIVFMIYYYCSDWVHGFDKKTEKA